MLFYVSSRDVELEWYWFRATSTEYSSVAGIAPKIIWTDLDHVRQQVKQGRIQLPATYSNNRIQILFRGAGEQTQCPWWQSPVPVPSGWSASTISLLYTLDRALALQLTHFLYWSSDVLSAEVRRGIGYCHILHSCHFMNLIYILSLATTNSCGKKESFFQYPHANLSTPSHGSPYGAEIVGE